MRYHSKIGKIYRAVGSFICRPKQKTYDLVDRLGQRKDRYGVSDAIANVHVILYGRYLIDYLSR